jgi:hypothetical protein
VLQVLTTRRAFFLSRGTKFFFAAKPSQNQLFYRRNSDSDRCGILFYARSGTVVHMYNLGAKFAPRRKPSRAPVLCRHDNFCRHKNFCRRENSRLRSLKKNYPLAIVGSNPVSKQSRPAFQLESFSRPQAEAEADRSERGGRIRGRTLLAGRIRLNIDVIKNQTRCASFSELCDLHTLPGANPTTVSYNASVLKLYNATGSLVRF